MYQFLQKISLYPHEPTVLLTAYTGIAAFNIGGITLHRALALQVQHRGTDSYRKLSNEKLHDLRMKWSKVHTIIIDEISFASSVVLTQIHLRLCEIYGNDHLFGGVNIIAFGDLFQLPPVAGTMVFRQPKKLVGQANIWVHNFKVLLLKENMRQKEDANFAHLLNRIRIGCQTDEDICLLQSRLVQSVGGPVDDTQPPFDNAIRIFPCREQCREYNVRQLANLGDNNQVYVVKSVDVRVSSRGSNAGTEYVPLESRLVPDDDDDCAGLASCLSLAVGARVMLGRNILTEDGLVNGAMGTVNGFVLDSEGLPKAVLVNFDDPKVGKILDQAV